MSQTDSTDLLQRELAEQRGLGNVCEACGVFLHELGNSLNVVLIELALLERQVPEALREGLGGLRKVGRDIAQQMQELRRYEDSQRIAPHAVDLNAVIQAAVAEGLAEPPPQLALGVGLAAVQATVGDLHRLVRLLVGLAGQMAQRTSPLELQTRQVEEQVQLRIHWTGPESAEPPTPPQAEEGHFAWIICQRLARRLRGAVQVETQPGGGAALVASLPMVPGTS